FFGARNQRLPPIELLFAGLLGIGNRLDLRLIEHSHAADRQRAAPLALRLGLHEGVREILAAESLDRDAAGRLIGPATLVAELGADDIDIADGLHRHAGHTDTVELPQLLGAV